MKKIVAFLLVAMMVLSCLPVLAGSNTAQTKDKINPDIKVDAKLDKTTLDLSKKDDVIKGTITFPDEEGAEYDDVSLTTRLTYSYEYENDEGKTETKTNNYFIYPYLNDSWLKENTYGFELRAESVKNSIYLGEKDKFVSASLTIAVSGIKEYTDSEKENENFFYEFMPITATGYKPDEPIFTIKADKELAKPGEDITVSYKYSGIVPKGYSFFIEAYSQVIYEHKYDYETFEPTMSSSKTEGKFVFTVPNTNCNGLRISYNCYYYNDEYTYWIADGEYILVDVNVTPPDEDKDLVYSPANEGGTTVVLRKENLETTQRQISITGKTADVVVPTYTWESSDEKIATVDANGLVKFLSEGSVTISGEAKVGYQEYYYYHRFTVIDSTSTERLVYSVADTETIWLKQKAANQKNVTINVTNVDPYGEVPTFIWTSSNPAVATVSGNTVIGVEVGTAVITGTGKIGDAEYTHSFTVVVEKNEGKVKKAVPSKKKLSLKAGKKATIKLTFKPDNLYAEPKVTWKSSDKKVATVKKGVIKAKKAGTCVITAKVKGLKKAIKIKVTVK